MNIYFSGIGGVGIGPLAEIAYDAGHSIAGSDLNNSPLTYELAARGVKISSGQPSSQDGSFLRDTHRKSPVDWFVYTAALSADHPELITAKELGIKTAKRDKFLAELIKTHELKLIAIAGTHGKTTTTGMMIWAFKQLGIPVSYSVGSTLSFGPSGAFVEGSEYFIYECDEFDKNLLHFWPHLSLLTSIGYDHPDTYPTEKDYTETFQQYVSQSSHTIGWQQDLDYISQPAGDIVEALVEGDDGLKLAGKHNRLNASLVLEGLDYLEIGSRQANLAILNQFPGTDRRFEKLDDNLYSDYGHHPDEIAATLQMAREIADDIVLVYQPHQNWRQHFIGDQYTNQFELAKKIYWLPTYLSRENPEQTILTPEQLAANVTNGEAVAYADLDDDLWKEIQQHRQAGRLVICMGAGTIDGWVRSQLSAT